MSSSILFGLCAFLAVLQAESSKFQGQGANLELISEVSTIAAGEPFIVGIKIRPHKDHHTYWKNPGIVGLPTSLKWTLPKGFEAGPIQWPAPERVTMLSHPAHGYKRDVLLLIEISPPTKIAHESVTLTPKITWMACASNCSPGETELRLKLPVGKKAIPDPQTKILFENARLEIPQAAPKLWVQSASIDEEKQLITLNIQSEQLPTSFANIYFYSFNGLVSSNKRQRIIAAPQGGFKLIMALSEQAPKERTHLNGVLAIQEKVREELKNYWLEIPLHQ